MKKLQRMSDAEREVMHFVWASGNSISSAALIAALKTANKDWKPNTVLTFLARLVEKGFLTTVRHGRANEYIPLVSKAEYKRYETRSFLNSVHGGAVKSLVAALCDGDGLTAQDLAELRAWFSEQEAGG